MDVCRFCWFYGADIQQLVLGHGDERTDKWAVSGGVTRSDGQDDVRDADGEFVHGLRLVNGHLELG